MTSGSLPIANTILVDQRDLKKLEDLDPAQSDGYKSVHKVVVPCLIRLIDDEQGDVIDRQQIVLNILQKKKQSELTNVRIEIGSEIDLYFNFVCNCNQLQFEDVRGRNGLNIKFKDFPGALAKMFEGCKEQKDGNSLEFSLSRDNVNTLRISQKTEYKLLDLLTLTFYQSELEKVNQSVVYRYNYQKAKLALLDSSLESLYSILEKKNPSLLQYIKKTVSST